MRLSKFLATAGVASRRAAEQYIADGRVKVNGITVSEQGISIDPHVDLVELDNANIELNPKVYLLLNKPGGYISSVSDPQGRPVVLDLLKDIKPRIYPVGRLDFDTEGLLLLTNDGDFTNIILHPRYQITKTYEALVQGKLDKKAIMSLRQGVELEDGLTAPAGVRIIKAGGADTLLQLDLREGKKREVKRMLKAVGFPVIRLRRTALEFLTLEGLGIGEYRHLSAYEVKQLIELAQSPY